MSKQEQLKYTILTGLSGAVFSFITYVIGAVYEYNFSEIIISVIIGCLLYLLLYFVIMQFVVMKKIPVSFNEILLKKIYSLPFTSWWISLVIGFSLFFVVLPFVYPLYILPFSIIETAFWSFFPASVVYFVGELVLKSKRREFSKKYLESYSKLKFYTRFKYYSVFLVSIVFLLFAFIRNYQRYSVNNFHLKIWNILRNVQKIEYLDKFYEKGYIEYIIVGENDRKVYKCSSKVALEMFFVYKKYRKKPLFSWDKEIIKVFKIPFSNDKKLIIFAKSHRWDADLFIHYLIWIVVGSLYFVLIVVFEYKIDKDMKNIIMLMSQRKHKDVLPILSNDTYGEVIYQINLLNKFFADRNAKINELAEKLKNISESLEDYSSNIYNLSKEISGYVADVSEKAETGVKNLKLMVKRVNELYNIAKKLVFVSHQISFKSKMSLDIIEKKFVPIIDRTLELTDKFEDIFKTLISDFKIFEKDVEEMVSLLRKIRYLFNQIWVVSLNAEVEASRTEIKEIETISQEIRNIADRSSELSQQIQNILQIFVDRIAKLSSTIGQTEKSVDEQVKGINEVKEHVKEIIELGKSVEETGVVLKSAVRIQEEYWEILENQSKEILTIFEKFVNLVEILKKSGKNLETISGKLVNISSEIKKVSQEILNILS